MILTKITSKMGACVVLSTFKGKKQLAFNWSVTRFPTQYMRMNFLLRIRKCTRGGRQLSHKHNYVIKMFVLIVFCWITISIVHSFKPFLKKSWDVLTNITSNIIADSNHFLTWSPIYGYSVTLDFSASFRQKVIGSDLFLGQLLGVFSVTNSGLMIFQC